MICFLTIVTQVDDRSLTVTCSVQNDECSWGATFGCWNILKINQHHSSVEIHKKWCVTDGEDLSSDVTELIASPRPKHESIYF